MARMHRSRSRGENTTRPNSGESEVVSQAEALFEQTLVPVRGQLAGAVAALESNLNNSELNYGELFLRDNVPVMVYLLLRGRFQTVRHFLDLCLELQSRSYRTRGVFPTSFVEEDGQILADYGQRSIGRITSVDASLWWPVLCWMYVRASGDRNYGASPKVQRAVQLLLDLVLQPSFYEPPVLFVPRLRLHD